MIFCTKHGLPCVWKFSKQFESSNSCDVWVKIHDILILEGYLYSNGPLYTMLVKGPQGLVLLQRSDAVAILSANGSAAFKECCAPIGQNSCDSIMSQ